MAKAKVGIIGKMKAGINTVVNKGIKFPVYLTREQAQKLNKMMADAEMLGAVAKKKFDLFGAIKKVGGAIATGAGKVLTGPVGSLLKTAVSFVPGVGPFVEKGLTLITKTVEQSGQIAGVISAGKKLMAEGKAVDVEAMIKASGLTPSPSMKSNIDAGIKSKKPVVVTDKDTLAKKTEQLTPEQQKTAMEKAEAEKVDKQIKEREAVYEKEKKKTEDRVYSLFDYSLLGREEPTAEEKFKAERKIFNDNVGKFNTNMALVRKKLKSTKNDALIGQYTLKLDLVQKRADVVWNEAKSVKGTLQEEAYIKLDMNAGFTVLKGYNNRINEINEDLIKQANEIDAYINKVNPELVQAKADVIVGKEQAKAEKYQTKKTGYQEKQAESEYKANVYKSGNQPSKPMNTTVKGIIIAGVIGLGAFLVVPKLMKSRRTA